MPKHGAGIKAILRYLDGKAPKKSLLSKTGLSMWLFNQNNQNLCWFAIRLIGISVFGFFQLLVMA